MTDLRTERTRREALHCLAAGSAGTLYFLAGGILTPVALAAPYKTPIPPGAVPLMVQISDTHIGFKGGANPDVPGTVRKTIELVKAMPQKPALALHTGDITHLSKAAEFDVAQQLLSALPVGELHAVPGEHDVIDGPGTEFFTRFGAASNKRGYYSFDHSGVHFVALVNVMNFKANGLGALGSEQLEWLEDDLRARSASTPIVVFAHMPLWNVYEPWGWGTGDADQAMSYLRRFGSVTVLNGHIHQIVQKVEGNITFHTARSAAYPQPKGGEGMGPGPLSVPLDQLPSYLGVTSVTIDGKSRALSLTDTPLS